MAEDEPGVGERAEEGPAPVTQAQFKTIMDALSTLRAEIKTSAEDTADSVSRRIKREKDGYQFKKRGHKLQFEFNEEVLAKVEEADSVLKKLPGTDQAKELLQKGMELLGKRQKHIKMADRSENGWAVVQEYEADALADDSDDEKKIEKAERAAEKKAVVAARKRKRQAPVGAKAQKVESPGVPRAALQQSFPLVKPTGRFPTAPVVRPIGPYHQCYEYGHLRRNCPLLLSPEGGAKVTSPRTYPLSGSVSTPIHVHINDTHDEGMVGEYDSSVSVVSSKCVELGMSDDECIEKGDYELCADKHPPVKGSLKNNVEYWEVELQASPFIIDTIKNGYPLPLEAIPPSFSSNNHPSAVSNKEFVDEALTDLLAEGSVIQLESTPHICSPLMVVTNDIGKKRLVLNLKFLNKFLKKFRFKYEDLRTVLAMIEKGDSLFSFDLKAGYHHVDIRESYQTYLGFSWSLKGKPVKHYAFTVLPFGLSAACYLFTKLLRPVVRYWRARGLRIVVYLDDGIGMAQKEKAPAASELVRQTLKLAGFVTHKQKSRWETTKCLQWLGFSLDTAIGQISVPGEKIA